MARGRPRKFMGPFQNRLSRMNAAIDAMAPYGFREDKVVKVIKALLKEYGGDDGWPFIELDVYQELIDAILRDTKQNDEEVPETTNSKENSLEDGEIGTSNRGSDTQQGDESPTENALADVPMPSLIAAEPSCSEVVSSSSAVNNEVGESTDLIGEDEQVLRNIVEQHTGKVVQENDGSAKTTDEVNPPGHGVAHRSPSLMNICSPSASNNLPTRRRRFPCFGWIESDEEDSYDFILLSPARESGASLPSHLCTSPNSGRCSERKRKSRWDQMPNEP